MAAFFCLFFTSADRGVEAGLDWSQSGFSASGSSLDTFYFNFNAAVRSPSWGFVSNPYGAIVTSITWLSHSPNYGGDPLVYGAKVQIRGGLLQYTCPMQVCDQWGTCSCSGASVCYGSPCAGACGSCSATMLYADQWGNPIYGYYSVVLYFTGVRNYIDEPYLSGIVPNGAPYGSNIRVDTGAVNLADPLNPIFNWTTSGSSQWYYRLQILQGSGVVWDSGDTGGAAQSRQAGPLAAGTTYTWRVAVAGPGYGSYESWTGWADGGSFVTVPPVPTVDIKADGSDGPITIAYNAASTISWSSTNASACSVSPTGWSGTAGSQSTGALIASQTYTVSCTGPGGGPVTDSVTVNVLPPPSTPSAGDLSSTQPNYCSSGPAATLSWVFSDQQAGDTQSAYQIQVDNNADFSSPEINTGKIISSSNSYSTGPGILQYNVAYNWRVMVWDSYDNVSVWSGAAGLSTPRHQYPTINFSWAPATPSEGESVQMADQSLVFGGATKTTWFWTIPDSVYLGGTNSSSQNPQVRFTSEGSKSASLQVTDSDGYTCSASKAINVRLPLPGWKEVAPQ